MASDQHRCIGMSRRVGDARASKRVIVPPPLLTEETWGGFDGNHLVYGDMAGSRYKGPNQTAARL